MSDSTAVTKVDRYVGLPDTIKAAMLERKARNAAAAAIASLSWGNALDQRTVAAVADYCHRKGLDPTEDVFVLGGRLYRSAAYYEKLLGALIHEGTVVEVASPTYIHRDSREEKLAETDEQAKASSLAKLRARIEFGAPEEAKAACVYRVRHKTAGWIVGVNWCGGGVKKNDPVGEAEPTKTAYTRALRRCLRQLRNELGAEESDVTVAEIETEALGAPVEKPAPAPRGVTMLKSPADPYAVDADADIDARLAAEEDAA